MPSITPRTYRTAPAILVAPLKAWQAVIKPGSADN